MLTRWLSLLIAAVALLAAHLPAQARIWDSVPDEQLQALQLSREASPKELFEALSKRYKAELNKGKLARYWEPIPMDMYLAPSLFYKPPDVNIDVTREQCVQCHGADGKGDTKMGKKLGIADLADPRVQAKFTDEAALRAMKEGIKDKDGKLAMKPAEGVSEAEMKALVPYLRALAKK